MLCPHIISSFSTNCCPTIRSPKPPSPMYRGELILIWRIIASQSAELCPTVGSEWFMAPVHKHIAVQPTSARYKPPIVHKTFAQTMHVRGYLCARNQLNQPKLDCECSVCSVAGVSPPKVQTTAAMGWVVRVFYFSTCYPFQLWPSISIS